MKKPRYAATTGTIISAKDVAFIDNAAVCIFIKSAIISPPKNKAINPAKDQSDPFINVYLEKDGTFISIQGNISLEEVYSIIDSLVVDN